MGSLRRMACGGGDLHLITHVLGRATISSYLEPSAPLVFGPLWVTELPCVKAKLTAEEASKQQQQLETAGQSAPRARHHVLAAQ